MIPFGSIDVDRRAPAVVDLDDVDAVVEPALAHAPRGRRAVGASNARWFVHAGSPSPRRDRRVEVGASCSSWRSQNAIIPPLPRVVEDVAGPTAFHRLGRRRSSRGRSPWPRCRSGGWRRGHAWRWRRGGSSRARRIPCRHEPVTRRRSTSRPSIRARSGSSNGWFAEPQNATDDRAAAMTIATATPDGRPSARVVLLRGFDERGLVFFTNYDSRKAEELEANPHAAALFYWPQLDRQVRVEGTVTRVEPRGVGGVLREPAARVTASARGRRRRARRSRTARSCSRSSTTRRRASRTRARTCRCRRSGVATG